jgi:hypothetical protein
MSLVSRALEAIKFFTSKVYIGIFNKPIPVDQTSILVDPAADIPVDQASQSGMVRRIGSTLENPSYKQLYDDDDVYFNRLGDRIFPLNTDLLGKLSVKLKRRPGGEVANEDDIKFDIATIEAINKIIKDPEQSFSKKVVKENLPILIAIYDKYKDNDQQIAENVEILRKILENTKNQESKYDFLLDTTQGVFFVLKTTNANTGKKEYKVNCFSRETRKNFFLYKLEAVLIRTLYLEKLYLNYLKKLKGRNKLKLVDNLEKSYICFGTFDANQNRRQDLIAFHQDKFPFYFLPQFFQAKSKECVEKLFDLNPNGFASHTPHYGFLDFLTKIKIMPITSAATQTQTQYRLASGPQGGWAPFFAYFNSLLSHATPDSIDMDELYKIYNGNIPLEVLDFAVKFNKNLEELRKMNRKFRRALLSFAVPTDKKMQFMQSIIDEFNARSKVKIEIIGDQVRITKQDEPQDEPQHWIERHRRHAIETANYPWVETTEGPALFDNIDDDGKIDESFRNHVDDMVSVSETFKEEDQNYEFLMSDVKEMLTTTKNVESIIVPERLSAGSKRNKSKRRNTKKKLNKLIKRRFSQRKQNKKRRSRKIK